MATFCTSVSLTIAGFGLIVIPFSTGMAFGLTLTDTNLYEKIMNKYNEYKKHYERAQQTINSFE